MDFALILLTLLNIIIIFLLLKRKTDHSAARFDAIGNALEIGRASWRERV